MVSVFKQYDDFMVIENCGRSEFLRHTECFSFRSEGPEQFRGIDTECWVSATSGFTNGIS